MGDYGSMIVYGCSWVCMSVYGCLWVSMGIHWVRERESSFGRPKDVLRTFTSIQLMPFECFISLGRLQDMRHPKSINWMDMRRSKDVFFRF